MNDDSISSAAPSDDLLVEIERLIDRLQHAHGTAVAAETTRLLEAVDAVHRAGLTHLIDVIRAMGGDAFVNRLIADPAIRILLMSYDLVAADRRLAAEEALDAVRGHLHAHGIDVEILEVVGGVVYVKLHAAPGAQLPEAAVLRDLEAALRAGFIGFQELVTRAPQSTAPPIPLSSLKRPIYVDAVAADALADGATRAIDVDSRPILVVRVAGEFFAVANRCGSSPLPLEFSTVDGAQLRCSWHSCRYDLRTGARLDAAGDRLTVYPVRVQNGQVQIAMSAAAPVPGAP